MRLFVLPKSNVPQTLVVISLDPPIRKGQTYYPHILCQFNNDDELNIELEITEEQLEAKNEKVGWLGIVLTPIALYCTVLYCAVLYCAVLYCNELYCTLGHLHVALFIQQHLVAMQMHNFQMCLLMCHHFMTVLCLLFVSDALS